MAPDPSAATKPPRRTGALHLATAWLTVLPVRTPTAPPDRIDGGRVIAAVPVLGLLLGGLTAAAACGLGHTRLPESVIGALCVALLALATRGMHLDGLADTADGLGCYGDRDRVRAVMRSGDIGPFGAATLVLVLLLQALTIAALAGEHRWYAIVFAILLGRTAVVIACRRAIPAANDHGFGALVAGTQRVSLVIWLLVCTALAAAAGWLEVPAAPPVFAVGAALRALGALIAVAVFAWAFTRHCARRTGGVSGDVLGATLELSTALALVLLLV